MELWQIKNRLRLYKINLSNEAKSMLSDQYQDYNTIGDYIIDLGKEVFVSVNFSEKSNYLLDYKDNQFSIYENGNLLLKDVEIHQVPKVINKTFINSFSQEVYVGDYIAQHGSRIRWMPNCQGYLCSNDCKFCEVWANKAKIFEKTPDDFEKAYNILKSNSIEKISELLVSGGTPRNDKESFEYMNKVYKKASDISNKDYLSLDIMFAPRGYYCDDEAKDKGISKEDNYILFFKYLKKLNVKDVAINLELWNERYRNQLIKRKNQYSREDYLRYLEIGVSVLGKDVIRSGLIVGLEPIEDTITATKELAKRQIRIIYSPYEPYLFEDSENNYLDYKFRIRNLDEDIKERFTKFNLSIEDEDDLTLKGYEICKKYNVGFGSKYPSSNHNNLSI